MRAPQIAESLRQQPIRLLIDGFEAVSAQPIPFARLPRSVRTAFGSEFAHWSDIADETVHSLRLRRRAGEITVNALLTAANAAVDHQAEADETGSLGANEAVRRLISQLNERDQVVLSARVWTHPPEPCRDVAERLGIHAVSVRRRVPAARAHLADLLANPTHREVTRWADHLRDRLGSYVPAQIVTQVLGDCGVEPGQVAQVLLHAAGPYVAREGWWENTATGGYQAAIAAVEAVFTDAGGAAPSTQTLAEALTKTGMVAESVRPFLDDQPLQRQDELWVRRGGSLPMQIESVLRLRSNPATAAEIHTDIGDALTLRAVQVALSGDERFVRVSPTTWGLRAWGMPEYLGLSAAIDTRLDAAGGSLDVDSLISDLVSEFPDVRESSIRHNLRTLAFIIENGAVRRRSETDKWPPVDPLSTVRGAFRNGDNEIRWAVPVSDGLLRGSGGPIPAPIAVALGVRPGQQHQFSSPHGPVEVRWRLSSTNGPAIGSLRALALAVNASEHDTLVVVFHAAEASISAIRIAFGTAGLQRLSGLLGTNISRAGRAAETALAASLSCDQSHVTGILNGRGDGELVTLVSTGT